MEQQPINYQDMIDLGGVRGEFSKDSFTDEYGYNYFWVDLKLTKKFGAHWDCETRTVEIQKYGGEAMGSILSSFPVKDLEQLKMFINLFKGIKPEDDRKPMEEFNPMTSAC